MGIDASTYERLASEPSIEAELNRRVRIADFSLHDLEELYAMRIVNEALAVRATVPRLTGRELQALHTALARLHLDLSEEEDA